MPTPPPRKRFQIHLSTAIVMMFVAGALMWANVNERASSDKVCSLYGFPFDANYVLLNEVDEVDGELVPVFRPYLVSIPLIENGLIALAILFAVWFLCEWLIRRRATRKGA